MERVSQSLASPNVGKSDSALFRHSAVLCLKRDCSASAGGIGDLIGDLGVVLAAGQRLSCEEGPACHAELVTVCTEVAAAVELHHLPGQAAQPPASLGDTSWTSWEGPTYHMISYSYDMPHCHRLYFCILP